MADTKNASAVRSFLDTPEPPALGPGPRPGIEPVASLSRRLDAVFAQTGLTEPRAALARAAMLLWHDHLDAAHALVQDIETPDGSYVHAILHRREPDYGNAKYWFRRVGAHPCFGPLARRATPILQAGGDAALPGKLLPRGQWDAFAFVDACAAAAGRPPADARLALLRTLQQAEFEVLLDYLIGEPS
jgi:hypothetical protein